MPVGMLSEGALIRRIMKPTTSAKRVAYFLACPCANSSGAAEAGQPSGNRHHAGGDSGGICRGVFAVMVQSSVLASLQQPAGVGADGIFRHHLSAAAGTDFRPGTQSGEAVRRAEAGSVGLQIPHADGDWCPGALVHPGDLSLLFCLWLAESFYRALVFPAGGTDSPEYRDRGRHDGAVC